ncbi:hypothetical protein [Tenacibaculum crassostreae]|uniref:hypothetical protein n=1 Tax=Tenacibaculum crassostreae TaxID=502683 RepID=UPI003895CC8D
MNTVQQLTVNNTTSKKLNVNLITAINNKIKAHESNAIGISVILIMVGTMIASITAALAAHEKINMFFLMFACISAMGANAAAISQRSFKTVVWAFIINIIGNILSIIYLLTI